ncbi:MAG: aldo/keto reductase [Armatimonadota bacterium]
MNISLSRLTLGTVQMGMSYGIANRTGVPPYEESREIIKYAFDAGINCLDTAAAYGDSEEVIARALRELGIEGRMVVVTKVPHLEGGLGIADADRLVRKSVLKSLKRLNMETLPICLFHQESNAEYLESLLKLKDAGLVGRAGCSVMTPHATSHIVEEGLAEAIQVPGSILDRRFFDLGICNKAAEKGITVFLRSIYLQGLLVMPEGNIGAEHAEVVPSRRRLKRIADEAGITLSELGLRFALSIKDVASVLVGVDTSSQMQENIRMFKKGPLPPRLLDAVCQAAPALPENIIMPNKWSKRMADTTSAGA